MFIEGNQIHNFMSSSGSGSVINYGSGSGSDFLTSYSSGSGSGSKSQKVTVPTVPVPVPQHWAALIQGDRIFRPSWHKKELLTQKYAELKKIFCSKQDRCRNYKQIKKQFKSHGF